MRAKVKNLRKSDGFTIIEVLIVLAIAGLIMLIVFLAVPALQRNARNTQRKNDVSALLSSVSEYVSNANGKLPGTTGSSVAFDDANNGFSTSAPKLGYYEMSNITYVKGGTGTAGPTNPNPQEKVIIRTGLKCNGATAVNTNASARNVVALYVVETTSGTQPQCQES